MKWSKLIQNIESLAQFGNADPEVSGIQLDSRKVRPGDLFVAIPGFKHDGMGFVNEAKARGACAVVAEKPLALATNGVVGLQVTDARKALGQLAKAFYEAPAQNLQLLGITGTNGKTTTARLVWSVLKHAGRPTSLIGTIAHQILGRHVEASNTTPESLDLYSFFKETRQEGGKAVVMEVSSHAIALQRIEGMAFAVAVFTNLTHDHLDFHKSLDNYFETKTKLFIDQLVPHGWAVINRNDEYGRKLIKTIKAKRKDVHMVTYGLDTKADVYPIAREVSWQGIFLSLHTHKGDMQIQSQLSGAFNISNIMAAVSCCLATGIQASVVQEGIAQVKGVEGRFENMAAGRSFAVVVDYAHTPDALDRLLQSARQLTQGRLMVVFGCGGDRDRTKRPVMGRIARERADEVIVTSDNPRTEDPHAIIQDIMQGIQDTANVTVQPDREKAIAAALQAVQPNGCVVIAGKGHEPYQLIGTTKHHFDDREIARKILAEIEKQESHGTL